MQTLRIVLEGNPRGQGRPRAFLRSSRIALCESSIDTAYKKNIRWQVLQHHPIMINSGIPIAMHIEFYFQRPKIHFDSKGQIKKKYLHTRHTGRPDVDNCVKAIHDAMNGIVWQDDAQVVDLTAVKYYANAQPHTIVEIKNLQRM